MRRRLAYAIGDAASCLAWNGAAAFLFASWLDLGLPAAVIGSILFAGQFITAFSDLAVGAVSDRCCNRGVGYRLWVRGSAVPIALALLTVFTVPRFCVGVWQVIVAAASYVLFLVVYSCGTIPLSSLLKTMTDDPVERTSFSSWRMAGAFLGAFAVTTGVPLLSEALSNRAGAICIVAACLCAGLLVSSFGVVERKAMEGQSSHGRDVPCRALGQQVFSRSFLLLFAVAVLFCAANGARFGVLAIFIAQTSASSGQCAGGFACLTLASAVGAGSVSVLSRRIRLPWLLASAAALSAVVSIAFFVLDGRSSCALYVFLAVVEFFSGMMPVICNVLVSSFADRCEGAVAGRLFAVWGLTGKLGSGLAALTIALTLTAWSGRTGALVALSIAPAVILLVVAGLALGGRIRE